VRLRDENTAELYARMGEVMQESFPGWGASILTGSHELLSNVPMKPERTNSLLNGAIQCQLAHYHVFTDEEKAELIRKAKEKKEERLSKPLTSGGELMLGKLNENISRIKPLMEEQGVTSYRIYDADMAEYAAAIDVYEGKWVNLQEYAAPPSVDPELASERLEEMIIAAAKATGIDLDNIYVKQRKEQKGDSQYGKLASNNRFYVMRENGCVYLINLTDYLDTGVFLDHRPIRKYIQENAKGKRFLNLFSYTGTASVSALKGGALSTTSVDASATYLDWAEENFRMNGFSTTIGNFFYKSDVIEYLWDNYDKFDLIFCDPPTFSNSKSREIFDVDRDHRRLIDACMMHLNPKGTLIFSTNFRKFRMDEEVFEKYAVQDITEETIGDDFRADKKIHRCFLIRKKVVMTERSHRVIKIAKPEESE